MVEFICQFAVLYQIDINGYFIELLPPFLCISTMIYQYSHVKHELQFYNYRYILRFEHSTLYIFGIFKIN